MTTAPPSAAKRRVRYLVVLSLLAFSFMLFQMSVLREMRYTLSTLFTLTPFVFSAVIFLIGLGSCAGRYVAAGTRAVLRWGLAILPLALLPLFALTLVLSQHTIIRPADLFFRVGADYIGAVGRAFIIVAVFGYGPVFFLQGLRDGRGRALDHSNLAPGLPHRLTLNRLALAADPGAGHLAANRACRRRYDLGADPVLDDDIADAELEREDELLGLGVTRTTATVFSGILAGRGAVAGEAFTALLSSPEQTALRTHTSNSRPSHRRCSIAIRIDHRAEAIAALE